VSRDRIREFYDGLAPTYDLIYPDWVASAERQGAAVHGLLRAALGEGPLRVLDCTCGIGTQLVGLAPYGLELVGTDLSPVATSRARAETGGAVPVAAADMRALPVRSGAVDAVLALDNAVGHLLTPTDLARAASELARVPRPGGLVMLSVRDYDWVRVSRPGGLPPSVRETPAGRAITFQLWTWHDDGERYDLELFQLLPDRAGWTVRRHVATYWALGRDQLSAALTGAGLRDVRWHEPADSGFFQLVVTARA